MPSLRSKNNQQFRPKIRIGVDQRTCQVFKTEDLATAGFSFMLVNVTNTQGDKSFTPSDDPSVILPVSNASIEDVKDDQIEGIYEDASYTDFCERRNFVLPFINNALNSFEILKYARIVLELITKYPKIDFIVMFNISCDEAWTSHWQTWNIIRTNVLNFHLNLFCGLVISYQVNDADELAHPWLTEPIKFIYFEETGLIEAPSNLIDNLLKSEPMIILPCFKAHYFQSTLSKKLHAWIAFIRNLEEKALSEKRSALAQIAEDLGNHGFHPLEPIHGNLTYTTYRSFEKCQIKYKIYHKAMAKAVLECENRPIHAAILGAGLGPLVNDLLNILKSTNRMFTLYAIEKNPNAFEVLRRRNRTEWKNQVSLVCSDIRHWRPAVQLHLIVSELLGGFGDNELSPECLYPIMRSSVRGSCIPYQYRSFVTPVMSLRTHQMILKNNDLEKMVQVSIKESEFLVSNAERFQQVWYFEHTRDQNELPEGSSTESNFERHAPIDFEIDYDGLLTGFAGYFEAKLYADFKISTLPRPVSYQNNQSKSKTTKDDQEPEQASWFPVYFPISTPIQVKKGSRVSFDIRRATRKHKVWYEWACSLRQYRTKDFFTKLHNFNGQYQSFGLDH